jgi:starvation-inducible DNA-binding protein
MSLKYLALEDGSLQIEGVGIPFGGPVRGKDLHGQYFSTKTDFAWDLIPDGQRPLLYQHGLDNTLKTAVIGRWAVKRVDDRGVWVQAQLNAHAEYIDEIKDLLDADSLGLSSATMGHLVKVSAKTGEILRWPVVELSLTPNPANPAAYVVKSAAEVAPVEYVAAKLAILNPEVAAIYPAELPAEEPQGEVPAPAPEEAPLISGLRELLSDVVAFYLEAHGAHWNVVGDDFAQYHALFGEIYEDVHGSIDPLAENLRKLNAAAPFSLADIAGDPSIGRATGAVAAEELVEELYASNSVLLLKILACFEMAAGAGEQGIANFLAERQDAHKKWQWQLSASLDPRGEQTPAEEAAEPVEPVISTYSLESTEIQSEEPVAQPAASLAVIAGTDAESAEENLAEIKAQIRAYARDLALKTIGR